MDLNEATAEVVNRHPWELSRTECIIKAFGKYIDRLHRNSKHCRYINVGAGDLYFDTKLMSRYKADEVFAVDIGYPDEDKGEGKVHKYHYLEEIETDNFDYAMMMDSLEYMEDDIGYVRRMSHKLKKGGYFFFTLPAFQFLFSEHDVIVKNLRRYDRKSFEELLKNVPELKIVESHYFYTSLFMVRLMQKMLRLSIDPNHKVTTGWGHSEREFLTVLVKGCLNLDFNLHSYLNKFGIRLPGLSLLVVCRKK